MPFLEISLAPCPVLVLPTTKHQDMAQAKLADILPVLCVLGVLIVFPMPV